MFRTWRALEKLRRAGCNALVVGMVLVGIGLSAAWGQGFPLKVRPLSQEELELVPGLSTSPLSEKPKGISSEPAYKGILPPRYAQVRLGDRSLTMAFDCSNPKARTYDVVYVDRRDDGNLAQEARVRATDKQAGPLVSFAPVMIELPFAGENGKGLIRVRAFISGEQLLQVTVAPALCLEGTVRLGTQEYRVALVDGDLSGVLGDGEAASCADLLLIDLNGNGTYDRRVTFPTPAAQEVRPLSEYWQVGGNWWSATVAGNWSTLTVKPAKVQYGELRSLGPEVQTLVFTSRRYGVLVPTFKGRAARVPVGEYAVLQMQVTAKDGQGRPWQLVARGVGERRLLKVAADTPAELNFSKPIVGTVDADTRTAGQVQFSLVLRAAGQQVAGLTVADNTPAEPTFTITDKAGKTVATGKFEYG